MILKIKYWIKSLRLYACTASLGPIILIYTFLLKNKEKFTYLNLILLSIGILFLHLATNLVNDYFDFKFNIDRKNTLGSSRVLVDNLLKAKEIRYAYILFYLLSLLIGVYFIYIRGVQILTWILIAIVGSYYYTGSKFSAKYTAMGEVLVFFLMGPCMFSASYFVLVGAYSYEVFLLSIPIGLLIISILTTNNYRDIIDDKNSGIKTLGTILGKKITRFLIIFEFIFSYLTIFYYFYTFNLLSFIPIMIIPLIFSIKLISILYKEKKLPKFYIESVAKHQFLFTISISLSFILNYIINKYY